MKFNRSSIEFRLIKSSILIGTILTVLKLSLIGIPLFFVPDIIVVAWILYIVKNRISINQSSVIIIFIINAIILIFYILFSEKNSASFFTNNVLVAIKVPFYIGIMCFSINNKFSYNIKSIIYSTFYIYPVILLWHILFYKFYAPELAMRPFFLFENNFEVSLILSFFCIITFIYKDTRLRFFVLMSIIIFLLGSRSGAIGYLGVSLVYIFTLSKRNFLIASILLTVLFLYIKITKNINFDPNKVDRIQIFMSFFNIYGNQLGNILLKPFGFGLYQQVPAYECMSLNAFAHWVTGNRLNCDPILFHAYFMRVIFQYGIYFACLIPLTFIYLISRSSNLFVGLVVVFPAMASSTSVGGFSNGIVFLGMIASVIAIYQVKVSSGNPNYFKRGYFDGLFIKKAA